MNAKIEFFVPGIPKTAGSKRPIRNKHTGKIVVIDSCEKGPDWKADIKAFAHKIYEDELWQGAVALNLVFFLPRPKSHYGTGRKANQLKPGMALTPHTKRPDIDKLSRAVLDALTGVIWKDDAQIFKKDCRKIYSAKPGVHISIDLVELKTNDKIYPLPSEEDDNY